MSVSEQIERQLNTCTWTFDENDDMTAYYETECGQAFILTEGTFKDNGMRFCCYCGKEINQEKV